MSTEAQEGLAPAAGNNQDDGVREYHPVQMWDKGVSSDPDAEMYDFRAKRDELGIVEDEVVDEEVIDPKASSAVGSVLAAIYETVKTPLRRLEQLSETPVSADTEVTQVVETENGSSISSETQETKTGSETPPVPEET